MSVLPSDLVVYGCADMPETDGATIGGAVDFSSRVAFYDVTPTGLMDVVSSSASDTATQLAYYGRDATGVIQNETLTLNGQTVVNGTKSLERLLYAATSGGGGATKPIATVAGTVAAGDVALLSHTAVISAHTAQPGSANHSGATPALFKMQSGDGANVSVGQIIRTTGGTGAQQIPPNHRDFRLWCRRCRGQPRLEHGSGRHHHLQCQSRNAVRVVAEPGEIHHPVFCDSGGRHSERIKPGLLREVVCSQQ